LSPHLSSSPEETYLPELDNITERKLSLNQSSEQKTTLMALRQAIIIDLPQYSDIEEPNDELVTEPEARQRHPFTAPAKLATKAVAMPVARPAPEPMDPEFVSFEGLKNPPIQTQKMKLHRRFANVLTEVERIEVMLDRLGITPDMEPEKWSPALTAAEEHVPALYIYRDRWRELLHLLPLQAPLRYYYVTSPYGMRTNKKNGVTRFHHGVDLAGTWKAKLRPPASGVVTFAGRDGGFGKVVRVQHAHGIETVYAHLSSVLVSKGSFVTTQDILGTMGNTGHSDGMHLHYEIRIDGKSKDPEDFFAYGHKLTITGALSGDM
jgi:murein DD-endopeptidase MepM/ murein hydrolase activator NlpD